MTEEHFFSTREALFSALAQNCADLLARGVQTHQRASFMVSGGSTPEPLFRRLSAVDPGWAQIDVALVDERWVDVNSEQSNQRLIKNSLLKNCAASARFTGMKTHHATAVQAQEQVNTAYQAIVRPFDIVLLGMGPDGHTASLFPGADALDSALDIHNSALCIAVNAPKSVVTGDNTERMSLTLAGITNAKRIFLLITGEDKLAVYQQVLTASDVTQTPVSAVLQQQQCPVSIFWAP